MQWGKTLPPNLLSRSEFPSGYHWGLYFVIISIFFWYFSCPMGFPSKFKLKVRSIPPSKRGWRHCNGVEARYCHRCWSLSWRDTYIHTRSTVGTTTKIVGNEHKNTWKKLLIGRRFKRRMYPTEPHRGDMLLFFSGYEITFKYYFV